MRCRRRRLRIAAARDGVSENLALNAAVRHAASHVAACPQRYLFDSFECAIHKLAPICEHCGCKVIGHGIQANGTFYCCAHCARHAGATGAVDHV